MVANRYHIYAIPGQRATIIKQDELTFLKRQCDEKSIAFYHMMCCIRPKLLFTTGFTFLRCTVKMLPSSY